MAMLFFFKYDSRVPSSLALGGCRGPLVLLAPRDSCKVFSSNPGKTCHTNRHRLARFEVAESCGARSFMQLLPGISQEKCQLSQLEYSIATMY